MSYKKYFLQFVIIFLVLNLQRGLTQNMKFNRLTVEDGLSQSWVRAICQDRYGFIWIGTDVGLNRYDGYNFLVYKNNPRNNRTISNNNVSFLFEDSKGNLWVGTSSGLNLYDRKYDQFIHKAKWPKNIIKSIVEDELHNLWIGTSTYLYYYNCKIDSFFAFKPKNNAQGTGQKDIGYISSEFISSVFIDSKKNVWVGSNCGLNLYNKETKTFINYYHQENNPKSLSHDNVISILEDKAGRLWVGTNAGLDLFDNAKGSPKEGIFTHFRNNAHNDKSITNGSVFSLLEDEKHNLWIGTENGGLNVLDLNNFNESNATFTHFRNDPNNPYSLSNNSIYSLFQDKQKNIWIGTYFKGINIFSRTANKFLHFTNEPLNANSLSNNQVNTFLEDGDFIWIGTEGGLNRFNKKDRIFKRFIHNSLDNTSIGADAVWAIYKDNQGVLWVGTWAGGLNRFDYKSQTFTHYYSNPNDINSLSSNNIFSIKEDKQYNLWIGTNGGGLNRLDSQRKNFTRYQVFNSGIFRNYVASIIETKKGDLWFACISSAERYNKATQKFEHHVHNSNDSTSLHGTKIPSIFEDSKENLWVGTDDGLNLFQKSTNGFISYTLEHGLPDNTIKSIIEDKRGNIWMGTNKGISCFVNAINLPQKPKFKNYTSEDGLQGKEFTNRSCLKSKDGWIYFGGVNGFNVFNPDSIKDNPFIPEVIITDFLIFNKPVKIGVKGSPLLQNISLTHELTLSYKHSVFSFIYAALNYVSPQKNQYAYKMEGFDKEWNYVGNKREATYTNLNPGTYTFKVKASNNDGIWNEKGTSLTLIILPPWWKTIWFRILVIIILILLINLFFYVRVASYKKKQKELTHMVLLRTQELEQTNTNLLQERTFVEVQKRQIENYANEMSLQNEGFKRINEQLREKQTQIEEQSEELRSHSENLKEANDLLLEKQQLIQLQSDKLQESNRELYILNSTKDRFFSIIAHDLRNPFHAVTGFSEILLRDYEKLPGEKIEKYLTLINKSSINGNVLLENLLQWSRAQTGTISYEPIILNLQEIVNDVLSLLEAQAQQKNIQIILSIGPKIMVNADENMLKTILRNLISNAIKFTREKGTVTIEALAKSSEVQISVTDTGVGISPDNLELLFNVETNISTKGTASESGTGLGLILCKEFVEKNGGKIWVVSRLNKGSEFKFTLPLV